MQNPEVISAESISRILVGAAAEFAHHAQAPRRQVSKRDGSILTNVDLALDTFLRAQLRELCPTATYVSEEGDTKGSRAPDIARSELAWLVDPLDGTKEFARGIPEFAVSVGLLKAGTVVAGGVINPATGEFAACGMDGSWTSSAPRSRRSVDGARPLSACVASVSRSEFDGGLLSPFLDLVGSTRLLGSAAYKLLRVACGHEDLTFSVQPKSLWDVCGGIALMRANDMAVICLDGSDVHRNRFDERIPLGFVAGPDRLVHVLAQEARARGLPANTRERL